MIKINRRDFLKGSAALGVAGAISGTVLNTLKPSTSQAAETAAVSWTPTTCVGCTTWCAVEVKTQTIGGITRALDVRGNTYGQRGNGGNIDGTEGGDNAIVCPRARIAIQEAYDPDRVKVPMKRTIDAKGKGVGPGFIPISWVEAAGLIAAKIKAMREADNADKIAYFRGRYTYSRKTNYEGMKKVLGTPNALSHSSICAEAENFARTCAVGRWGYDDYDLDNCRYLLLWGVDPVSSNRLVSGTIHKFGARMNAGMTVVAVDPRLHATAAKADKWLPVNPGTDGALALAIAHQILVADRWNKAFVGLDDTVFTAGSNAVVGATPEKGTKGLVDWWNNVVKTCTPAWAAAITGISAATIIDVATGFSAGSDVEGGDPLANKANAISWLGPGIAMQPNAVYGAWAAIMLNALVGSFDHLGGDIQAEPSNHFYTDSCPSPTAYLDGLVKSGSQKITKYVASGVELPMPALSASGTNGNFKVGHTTPTNRTADAIRDSSPYETKLVISAMSNWPFSCTGAKRWEDALSTGNAYNTGDMSAWSPSVPDAAPPFIVDISTHCSELGMFADIILPAKHVGLEARGSTHQRSGKYKTHSLYNPVIDPVWPDAKTAENEVTWKLAQALKTAGWPNLINYFRTEFPAKMGEPTLDDTLPDSEKAFELVATKYHATSGKIGSGTTEAEKRQDEWNKLNEPYALISSTLYAGNGFSQATYGGTDFDASGRGKAWNYAVFGTGATKTDEVATDGTATTVVKADAGYTPDAYKKQYVVMKTGACAGQARFIKSNTADTLTLGEKFSDGVVPAPGDTYDIVKSLFTTYSAKPEFYNPQSMLRMGLDAVVDATTTPDASTWYEVLAATNYNDTAALVGAADTNKQFAIMPHWEVPNIDDGGAPLTYNFTFIDHKSRLNREGRSANTPLYNEFKQCDAGDEKWKDVVKINPNDAYKLGVKNGDTVRITSPSNTVTGIICIVKLWQGVRRGTVAKSYGQGHWAYGRFASRVFGSGPNGGNNNEILPGQWERLSGANARNGVTKVHIQKIAALAAVSTVC